MSEEYNPISFSNFDPSPIPWQYRLIHDLHSGVIPFDKSPTQKIMCSGAVGSAKSTLGAWIAIYWCVSQERATTLIGRKSLPDLRDTLYKDIEDMLENDEQLQDGIDYTCYSTTCRVVFHKTKSEILARTWSDKKYKKARSLRLCLSIIEEGTENNKDDKQAHDTILQRLNRIGHIKKNLMLVLTNPDGPNHWLYSDYIEKAKTDPNTHVYYSLTSDNPFIDQDYVRFLEDNLSEADADRQLRGIWREIDEDRTYPSYDPNKSFLRDTNYKLDTRYAIDLMMDFNIAKDKPMSWAMGQYIDGVFHIFKEFHAYTMRTEQMMDELADKGAFELPTSRGFRVYGDASGKHNDTRSLVSDYEIIDRYLSRYKTKTGQYLEYSMEVPKSNPPLRRRHNLMNGLACNSKGVTKFFVYKNCDWVDEGFRLTAPKNSGDIVEDDSLPQQHVTTAIGYWADMIVNRANVKRSSNRPKA